MILAGGRGDRLSILSAERAKPAVPFAGKYRIIDFSLSNCANSGIAEVAVLTQYNPRSLMEHIGIGRPWDLDRGYPRGLSLLQPFRSRTAHDWYRGTADAVYQNLAFVEEKQPEEVLLLAGDHIYAMDYSDMLEFHRTKQADLTLAVTQVPVQEAARFGIVTVDESQRLSGFEEKPQAPQSNLASMGIYIFSREVLMDCLEEDALRRDSEHDFGRDVLPRMLARYDVYCFQFGGYWQDVGTIESYWQANMDLLADTPSLDLYDPTRPIATQLFVDPPARIAAGARITRSLVCHGSVISGTVENSVLSRRVIVEEGAVVTNSIIFSGAVIGKNAVVDHCIIDKRAQIGLGCYIGYGENLMPNWEEPEVLNSGITLIGKSALLPPGVTVGKNCKVASDAQFADFHSQIVPCGASISARPRRRKRRGLAYPLAVPHISHSPAYWAQHPAQVPSTQPDSPSPTVEPL